MVAIQWMNPWKLILPSTGLDREARDQWDTAHWGQLVESNSAQLCDQLKPSAAYTPDCSICVAL